MSITRVINDAIDLNQTNDYSSLRLPVGTTSQSGINFDLDYLIVAGGGGGGTGITASYIGTGGGGGAGGLRTSYNNSTTTTNTLSFPSGKTAIATYMLDGTATDVSGNYNGTESGDITYNTGKYGGAAVFNGSNTKITRENIFDNTQVKMSASVWVKATDYSPSSNINILDIGDNDTAVAQNRIFISGTSPHKIFVSVNGGTGGFAEASQSFTDNTWNHIVATWDVTGGGVTNGIKIYLNGSLAAQGNSTQGFNSARDLALGVNEDQANGDRQYFNGSLDQIRIYNSELSAQDVANIYSNEVQANSGGGAAAEPTLSLTFGTPYTVTIGDGGTGGLAGSTAPTNGQNSVFSNITSLGGGAGASYISPTNSSYYAKIGGSGGGAAYISGLTPGAAGTTGQGYAGGDDLGNSGNPAYGHAGGGGAAARGANGSGSGSGAGGDGLTLSITGTSSIYGGGGGGGGVNPYPAGAGGSGGGGAGGYGNGNPGYPGAFNTGGGGGGAGKTNAQGTLPGDGADGGSGVVILRYATASVSSFSTTGTLNTPSTTDTISNTAYPATNSAYYKLDGNGTDSSGNGNNVTPANITWQNGRFNECAFFNGSNSYLYAANSVQQPTTNYSVSIWTKLDTLIGGGSSGSIGFIGNFKSGVTPQVGFAIAKVSNESGFSFWADGTANSRAAKVIGTTVIQTGVWYHVVGTYDGTNVKIYVNGNLENTAAYSFTPNATDQPLVIGRWYGNYSDYYLGGQIDQVRIFATALTYTQVTDLYNEHYQTKFTDGSDTAIMFTEGTGNITFTASNTNTLPIGALRTNTDLSPGSANSGIEVYDGTQFKTFSATIS